MTTDNVVLWLFLRETEVKQRWARLVHAWVTVHDRSRFVARWGVLMQPKNRYRMTPGVRHSCIVNWLIYLIYSLLRLPLEDDDRFIPDPTVWANRDTSAWMTRKLGLDSALWSDNTSCGLADWPNLFFDFTSSFKLRFEPFAAVINSWAQQRNKAMNGK